MRPRRAPVLLAAALIAASASAHDSWLSPAPDSTARRPRLELATGNRYPVQETPVTAASLAATGCLDGGGRRAPMRVERVTAKALRLAPRTGALACWIEIQPFDITIEPALVQVYFDEIRPPGAVRQAWADLQARGVAWQERYRKFARIELAQAADASPAQRTAARRPLGQGLEIVVLGDAPVRPGVPLTFQVLRDGQPWPDFAVELVSERSPIGVWRETDAEGRLRHTLPFAGRWLLRGTELRLASGERWESRFVTLAIEAR